MKEIDRYKRYQRPFVVIICDIDDFKKVNDIYGHETGDEMLRFLSARIVENIRSADYFGRWGGEEFLLLLPETTYQQGMLMAESLRKLVEGATFPTELGPLQKTMTFGLSEYDSSLTIEETISRADRSLLQGKAAGKNRVVGFCEIDPDQYFCKEERAEDGSQPEMS